MICHMPHFERPKISKVLWPAGFAILRLATGVVLLLAVSSGVKGQTPGRSLSEYQIKGAFIYNFAKYVEWPPSAFTDSQAPCLLCILGKDPFRSGLDFLSGKTVRGHRMVVERHDRPAGVGSCHILFISASERQHLSTILKTIEKEPVLTVGDMENFAQLGGVIQLFTRNNKIRFAINHEAATRVGLKVSSKLLHLSRTVGKAEAEERD